MEKFPKVYESLCPDYNRKIRYRIHWYEILLLKFLVVIFQYLSIFKDMEGIECVYVNKREIKRRRERGKRVREIPSTDSLI